MSVVATIRPACDGIFGPCVAVEEGTTNHLQSPLDLTDTTVWVPNAGLYPVSEVPSAGPHGGSAFDLICNGTLGDPYFYQTYNTGASLADRTFTFSVYMRSDTPNDVNPMALYLYDDTAATDVHFQSFTVTREWRRYNITVTFAATVTDTLIRARIDPSNPSSIIPPDGTMLRVALPQLEEKPFATSFVDGTRGDGQLYYPLAQVLKNRSAWTVAFWVRPLGEPSNGNRAVFWTIGQYTNPTTEDYQYCGMGALPYPSTLYWHVADRLGIAAAIQSTSLIQPGNNYLATLVWDKSGTDMRYLYLNGALEASTSLAAYSAEVLCTARPEMWVGHYSYSAYPPNALFSNFLVLPYAVDADTVAEWYALQKPFFDPAPQIVVPRPSNVSLSVA